MLKDKSSIGLLGIVIEHLNNKLKDYKFHREIFETAVS